MWTASEGPVRPLPGSQMECEYLLCVLCSAGLASAFSIGLVPLKAVCHQYPRHFIFPGLSIFSSVDSDLFPSIPNFSSFLLQGLTLDTAQGVSLQCPELLGCFLVSRLQLSLRGVLGGRSQGDTQVPVVVSKSRTTSSTLSCTGGLGAGCSRLWDFPLPDS